MRHPKKWSRSSSLLLHCSNFQRKWSAARRYVWKKASIWIMKYGKRLKRIWEKHSKTCDFTACAICLRLTRHSQAEGNAMTKKSIRYNNAELACRCMHWRERLIKAYSCRAGCKPCGCIKCSRQRKQWQKYFKKLSSRAVGAFLFPFLFPRQYAFYAETYWRNQLKSKCFASHFLDFSMEVHAGSICRTALDTSIGSIFWMRLPKLRSHQTSWEV